MGEPRQDGERPRATRWPELNRRRRELAEAGEVGPLWELVTTAPWSMVNHEDVFRLLLGALEVRARRDPQGFAEECFARMVGMTSYLVYRSHYILGLKVEAHAALARRGALPTCRGTRARSSCPASSSSSRTSPSSSRRGRRSPGSTS